MNWLKKIKQQILLKRRINFTQRVFVYDTYNGIFPALSSWASS